MISFELNKCIPQVISFQLLSLLKTEILDKFEEKNTYGIIENEYERFQGAKNGLG
jgi:hypothetical protein